MVLAGLLDDVDGAVAVVTGRASALGLVLDSVADRVGDLLFLGVLLAAGAPLLVCAAGGAVMLLQEYLRARAAAAGMPDIGVVTVWERPTRVIVTAAFLASAAVLGSPWPTLAAWAWVALGVVGLGQLALVVRRRLGQGVSPTRRKQQGSEWRPAGTFPNSSRWLGMATGMGNQLGELLQAQGFHRGAPKTVGSHSGSDKTICASRWGEPR